MQRSAEFNVIVHYPKTEEARRELEKCVADVHADAAAAYIEGQPCPAVQKIAIADSIANAARQ